jgi:glycosyltransferase involved in cell wall biosynthesis
MIKNARGANTSFRTSKDNKKLQKPRRIPMYEEIIELINKGEINKAQEQIEKISDDDPKKYNLKGLIHFNKKELEKAKEQFEKGLKINPVDSDLLFNYGYLLKEMNQESQAWRYLMRIHNKDWATYDLLGDIEFKNRSKLASLRFYLKAAELTDNPQMKKKFLEIRNKLKKDTKIAFLCLPGLDNFLKDIVEIFSLGYDVKLIVSTDGNEITEAIKWADIVWLEWANDLAVLATNKVPEIANKKVICRLHRYEAFTQFPEKINWGNIDRLIFVANSMKLMFHKLHPNIDLHSCKEEIVYNGVDLDKFKFSTHKPGYNLAVLAHINYRKNPETWIQIISKLKDLDNKYKLHVGGDFQDPLYKEYFEYIKKEMKMEDNFILHGWINEVEKFLEDKNYIISTSIHEGHPYNILESMARGIKPIILNYSGSKEQWPNELIYNTIDEAVEKITEESYDSESYRRFIEDNYSLEEQIHEIEEIVENFYKSKSFEKKLEDMENTLVTIGVTNYNSEKYVKEFLDSVIDQTFKNIELIIVDDHSTDKSVEIIKEYERKYDFIKLIEHEVNKGCPDYGRNEILNAANGEYVLFLDSDDKFTYNYSLEKLVDFIQRNEELDYVYTDYAIIDGNSKITNKWESKVFTKEEIIRTVFKRMGSGILPGKGLFKVNFFRGFNINYPINGTAADTLLSLICLKNNMKYCYLKSDLISYRIHENNFTMNKQKRLDSIIPIIDYILENFLETLFPQSSKEAISFELYSYFKRIFYTFELELWKPWGIDYVNFHYTSVDYSKLVNIIRKYSIIHEKYKEKYEFLADYLENLNTRKYKPLVSILIPTYNLNNFFKQAFESALSQSYPNIEILVSDDSTEPAIEEYIQDFLANYKGDKVVKFYRHTPNNNDWGIRNHDNLLEKASGEYISFLHQDDLIHEEKIRLMMHFFILEEDISSVTSYRVLIDNEGKKLEDSVAAKRIVDSSLIGNGHEFSRSLLKSTINFIGEPSTTIFKYQNNQSCSNCHSRTVVIIMLIEQPYWWLILNG